jgi:hypothetical protein
MSIIHNVIVIFMSLTFIWPAVTDGKDKWKMQGAPSVMKTRTAYDICRINHGNAIILLIEKSQFGHHGIDAFLENCSKISHYKAIEWFGYETLGILARVKARFHQTQFATVPDLCSFTLVVSASMSIALKQWPIGLFKSYVSHPNWHARKTQLPNSIVR